MRFLLPTLLYSTLFSCAGNSANRKSTQKPPPKAESSTKEGMEGTVNTARKIPTLEPVLLGWYCPKMAMERPGVVPIFARDPDWTEDRAKLERSIASRRVKQFSILGWPGRRAGQFSVAGLATVSNSAIAIGSYQGASTCDTANLGEAAALDSICAAQTQGCGLAISNLEAAGGFEARPYEEDPERSDFRFTGACEVGQILVLDTDGDGVSEKFVLDELIEGAEAPAELASSSSPLTCETSFASVVHDKLIRLATLDMDGDGRLEVLFVRGQEEFLLYGAPNHPARLELLARHTLTSE